MATRLRLTNSAAPYTPASIRGTWDVSTQTGASALSPTAAGTAATVSQAVGTAGAQLAVLLQRFVSAPMLSGGALAGTVDWVMPVLESGITANAVYKLHIYVTAGDTDTVRGTLLAGFVDVAANEWGTAVRGVAGPQQTLSSVTCSPGDRIVVMVGWVAKGGSTSASGTGSLRYGGTGSDATSGSTGSTDVGWVEFSGADVLFTSTSYPATASLSGAGSLTAAPSQTLFGTDSMAGSGSLTAGPTQAATGVAALTGAGALAAGGARDQPATAALSGGGSLSAAATLARPGAVTLVGGGSLSATAGQVVTGALSGGGTLTAAAGQNSLVVALLAGGGSVIAATVTGQLAVAVLAGGGSLLAAATPIRPAGAALAGSGVLVAAGQRGQLIAAALAGSGVLVAAPTLAQPVVTNLAGRGSLTAVAWQTFAAGVVMVGGGALLGSRGPSSGIYPSSATFPSPTSFPGTSSGSSVGPPAATLTQVAVATLTGGGALLAGGILQVAPDHSRSQLGLPARVLVQPTRVIAQSILTGQFLHWDLPVSNLAVTFTLSGPTVITGNFPTEIHDLRDVNLEPWSVWLHVEEGGLIRASGILQPSAVDQNENLTVEAVGVSAYAKGIAYEGAFALSGTDPATGTTGVGIHLDPADIVRAIWAELNSFPDARLGVIVTGSTTARLGTPPVPVDFVPAAGAPVSFVAGPYSALDWFSAKDCGSEIDALAKSTPFDYVERSEWNATKTGVNHFVDIGYPRSGSRLTEVRFAQDENLLAAVGPEETVDQYASEVVVLGAGEGSARVRGRAARPLGSRIRRQAIIDDKSVTTTARANALAASELDRRQALQDVTEVTVQARHPNAPLGSFAVGDEVLVSALVPWAGEVRLWQRVLSYTYSPDSEAIKVNLRNAASFTYQGA